MGEKWIFDSKKGKALKGYSLRIALCFPDSYGVGMSNLGFLWVYALLNRYGEVRCDRFFIDNRQLNKKGGPAAFETGRALGEYDVAAFSLPYEGGYPAVPAALAAAGIEPLAAKRRHGPLVIAGGVAASANPEPIADFLDAVFVGEAEVMLAGLVNACIGAAKEGRGGRLSAPAAKSALRSMEGCYLPGDYSPAYGPDGTVSGIEVLNDAPEVVTAVHADPIPEAAFSPVISDRAAFHGMFLVEASRGCPYRCRFCMAGHTSHRFRPSPGLKAAVARGLDAAAARVGFIGTAFTKSGEIREACRMVSDSGGSVSFSSIRMDRRTLDLLAEIGPALDIESVAAAPEVATAGLARVIGKDISGDMEMFLEKRPLPVLKKLRLYYLIGVPGETDEDVAAIVGAAAEIGRRSGLEVLVSATPMIPKPFTPMQWSPLAPEAELRRKKRILKKAARETVGVSVKIESIEESVEQAVLSKGDRRIGKALLEAAVRKRPGEWMKFLPGSGPGVEFYTGRPAGEKEIFPWEVISHRTPGSSLYEEYQEAMRAAEDNRKRK